MKETPELRSCIMRAVKSTDTAPELLVRRLVHRMGYRFRLHRKDLPGKPDLTFPSRHKAIFVHGCFWHGHGCVRGARKPKRHHEYWLAKIAGNRKRDRAAQAALRRAGWQVAVIWECELKEGHALATRIGKFLAS